MKRKTIKFMAFVISVFMLLSLLPLTTFAVVMQRDVWDIYQRDVWDVIQRDVQDVYQRTVQGIYQRDVQDVYQRTVQDIYQRDVQDVYQRTIQEIYQREIHFDRTDSYIVSVEASEYYLVSTNVSNYNLVNTWGSDYYKVDTVYDYYYKVNTVYGIYYRVDTVYGDYYKVNTVYSDYYKEGMVYSDYYKVKTVYGVYYIVSDDGDDVIYLSDNYIDNVYLDDKHLLDVYLDDNYIDDVYLDIKVPDVYKDNYIDDVYLDIKIPDVYKDNYIDIVYLTDKYFVDYLPDIVYSYTAVVTPPTCTEQGYTTYTCECGEVFVLDYVPALGHDWNEGEITIQATSESEGEMTFTCKICGETYTVAIPKRNSINVNGMEIMVEVINGTAVLKPTQEQMTEILNAGGNEIVFDLRGLSSAELYVKSGWFKDIDKTLTIITDNGGDSVKTKSLWNNSGKEMLITARNGKLSFKNV